MYEYKVEYQGINIEVSLHERFKNQLETLNKTIDSEYGKITDSKVLKKIFSYGENILDFKNDTEFIVIDSDLNVGFCCSIYATSLDLEIELTEIKNKKSLPKQKASLITLSANKFNQSFKVVV